MRRRDRVNPEGLGPSSVRTVLEATRRTESKRENVEAGSLLGKRGRGRVAVMETSPSAPETVRFHGELARAGNEMLRGNRPADPAAASVASFRYTVEIRLESADYLCVMASSLSVACRSRSTRKKKKMSFPSEKDVTTVQR